jgi:hypothetical protein
LLLGSFAVCFTEGEEQIRIIWKLRSCSSQLKQRRIHLSCVPKRCSQPTHGLFVLWVLSDGLAQERDCLRRMIQPNFIDPQPEADTIIPGLSLPAVDSNSRGIVEFRLGVIDHQDYVCLSAIRRKLQDSSKFLDCIIKPFLLLGLLSGEKVKTSA